MWLIKCDIELNCMLFKYYCAPDIYDCVFFQCWCNHDLESEYIHLETNPMFILVCGRVGISSYWIKLLFFNFIYHENNCNSIA